VFTVWADWKGTVNIVIILLWLKAVDFERISNSQTESLRFTLDVVLCQGMWASGLVGGLERDF
jgi:hypothetical protein